MSRNNQTNPGPKDKITTDTAELESLRLTLSALSGLSLANELKTAGLDAKSVEAANAAKILTRAAMEQAKIAEPSAYTNMKEITHLAVNQIERKESACVA